MKKKKVAKKLSSAAQVLGDVLEERGVDAHGMKASELVIEGRELELPERLLSEVIRRDILDVNLPVRKRVQEVARTGVLSTSILDAWLNTIVERAVRNHALRCDIPEVENWAQKWLSGEDRSEAAAWAAEEAARAAADEAEAWAAEEAARAAAEAAAWTAEARAAEAAAEVAAEAAAWKAEARAAAKTEGARARAAEQEYERQVEDLREIL